MSSTIAGSVAAVILSSTTFDKHSCNASPNNDKPYFPNCYEVIHRTTTMHSSNNNRQPWCLNNTKIKINIRGTVYETYESTLAKYPDTLLGCSQKRDQYYDAEKRQFCFNCDRQAFNAILYYFQSSGKLIRPNDVNEKTFLNDLEFFEIDPWNVAELEYESQNFKKPEKGSRVDGVEMSEREGVGSSLSRRHTKKLRTVCNTLLSWPCAICVVVYLFTVCLSSMPEYQSTLTTSCKSDDSSIFTHDNHIVIIYFVCTVWFVLEFILRISLAILKLHYILSFMGAIDIISATSTLLQIILRETDACQFNVLVWFSNILTLSSFLCIFKFSRYSTGLRLFGQTLKACSGQFILSLYCIAICLLFYSAIIYYNEAPENEDFRSIFDAFWYTMISFTTVGYGDIVPVTILGRVFGALCSIFGATIIMAWPATIFVSYFSEIYNHQKSKKAKKKRNLWSRTKYQFRKSLVRFEKIRDQR